MILRLARTTSTLSTLAAAGTRAGKEHGTMTTYARLRSSLAAALALGLCLAAAAASPAAAAPAEATATKPDPTCGPARTQQRTVNHTFGSLVMRGTPRRVVALEFSFVDAMLSVGVKPVGLADDNNRTRILKLYRDDLGGYISVGLRQTPNLEAISSLKPDLIIADADRHKNIFRQLERIAPTIVLDSLQQAYLPNLHSAVVIGQAVNRCGAMIKRVQRHKENIKRIARVIPDNEQRNAMFAVSTTTVFNMHNSRGYTPSLLQAIGIKATEQQKPGGNPYHELTLETLFTLNPDILFIARYGTGTMSDKWQSSPIWAQLKAVRNNKVFYVNGDLWSRWRGMTAGEVIAQQTARLIYKKYVPLKIG